MIDSLDFARHAKRHHDDIEIAALLRLHDMLYENFGTLRYEVSGGYNKQGKPSLLISVQGELQLCCHRCLGRLQHQLDLQSSILLAKDETELALADEDDSVDAILATSDLDVLELVEDEIILNLSMSARHPEGECALHEMKKQEQSIAQKNPFSTLATLKKKH